MGIGKTTNQSLIDYIIYMVLVEKVITMFPLQIKLQANMNAENTKLKTELSSQTKKKFTYTAEECVTCQNISVFSVFLHLVDSLRIIKPHSSGMT